jgi:peptidoglycan lytic transglycosylase D
MKRYGVWAMLGLVSACAGHPRQPVEPAPAATPAAEAPPSAPVEETALAPQDTAPAAVPATALADSAAEADSAADAAILERLAASHPEARDSGADDGSSTSVSGGANAASTPEVTYDIDVSTYGSHARVKYYLDFFQGPARERMSVWLQRMPRYESMIRAKLREYQVPEDMVYLALIESGYSNSATSRARAAGMWQFIKGTGKLYGLKIDSWVDERRDPIKATDAAARHLADLRDQFGSMYLAAAAYNAGAGKVGRGIRRLGPDDDDDDEDNPDATFFRLYDTRFLRRETKDYVPKLIAAALIAKQPEKYGFERATDVAPLAYDSIIVPDATGLDVLARLSDTTVAALRDLNPQYIRRVTPPRRQSVVRLPLGSGEETAARYAELGPKSRVSYVEHVVTRGQTLAGIARIYHVNSRLIADANPGVHSRSLRPGTRIVVPTSFVPPVVETSSRTARLSAGHGSTTIRYRVRSGESLWLIAGKYNTTVEKLRSLNDMSRGEALRAGQVIRVPAVVDTVADPGPTAVAQVASQSGTGRTHVVRRGETLSGIAAHYGVGLSSLRSANGLRSTSVLRAGATLVIPE